MRPLRLTLQAFGAFVQKQTIDFSQCAEFFLIAGATGSGKTTLFDAMVFALYGQLTGTRSSKEMRSQLAGEEIVPWVELEFVLKRQKYKIRRTLPFERAKLKQGRQQLASHSTPTSTVWEMQRVELFQEQYEQMEWVPIVGSLQEINSKIVELLGLSCEEFTRIILLPQGEFQKFLEEDTAEKKVLLGKLFPTQSLAQICERAKEQSLRVKDEMQWYQQRLQQLLEQWDPQQHEINLQLWQQQEQQAQVRRQELEEGRETCGARLTQGKILWQEFQDWQMAQQQYQKLLQRQDDILEKKRRCLWAQKVVGLLPLLEQLEGYEGQGRELTAAWEKNQQKKKELQQLAEEMQQETEQAKLWPLEISRLQEKVGNLKPLLAQEKRMRELEKILQQEEKKLHCLQQDWEEKTSLQQKWIQQSALLLSQVLKKEGGPCWVCGSLDHPKIKAETANDDETSAAIAQSPHLSHPEHEWEHLKQVIHEQQKKLARWQGEWEAYNKAVSFFEEGELEKIFEQTCQQLQKMQEKHRQWEQQQQQWQQWHTQQKMQEEMLEVQRRELEVATTQMQIKLEEKKQLEGMAQTEDVRSFSLARSLIMQWSEEVTQFETAIVTLQAQLQQLGKKWEGQQPPQLAPLEMELKKWQTALLELEEEKLQRQAQREKWLQGQREFQELNEKKEKLEREGQHLIFLSDLLSGKNAKRISLENFVLSDYLDKITYYASQRFLQLSSGRYQLQVRDAGEKQNRIKQAGLDLNVLDAYSGKVRSVGSLSGGEKFMAALCLALGLSDVYTEHKGGVALECLFIDEGFGSLDEEALEMALNMLDEMRGQRLVGVISHVPELKRRILQQMEVRKTPQGSMVSQVGFT